MRTVGCFPPEDVVERHNTDLHSGKGVLVSYIDYLVCRKNGYYNANPIPNFISKAKTELVSSPPKLGDVFQEEIYRETARPAFRKEQTKSPF